MALRISTLHWMMRCSEVSSETPCREIEVLVQRSCGLMGIFRVKMPSDASASTCTRTASRCTKALSECHSILGKWRQLPNGCTQPRDQLQGVQMIWAPLKAAYLAQVRQQLAGDLAHVLLVADIARQARQQLGRHAQILQVETQALQVKG